MIEEKTRMVGSKAFSSSPFGHMLAFDERPRFPSVVGKFGWITVHNGVQDSSDSTQQVTVHRLGTAYGCYGRTAL